MTIGKRGRYLTGLVWVVNSVVTELKFILTILFSFVVYALVTLYLFPRSPFIQNVFHEWGAKLSQYLPNEEDERTHTFANGAKYVGAFKDGLMHGQGTLTSANGEKSVGEFKSDGQGIFTLGPGAQMFGPDGESAGWMCLIEGSGSSPRIGASDATAWFTLVPRDSE